MFTCHPTPSCGMRKSSGTSLNLNLLDFLFPF
uniref:Uncharacterized protein n=1 Tax=Anguilla anguilla TaxID=7936 RepID=A0A0E9RNI8_ANGAN